MTKDHIREVAFRGRAGVLRIDLEPQPLHVRRRLSERLLESAAISCCSVSQRFRRPPRNGRRSRKCVPVAGSSRFAWRLAARWCPRCTIRTRRSSNATSTCAAWSSVRIAPEIATLRQLGDFPAPGQQGQLRRVDIHAVFERERRFGALEMQGGCVAVFDGGDIGLPVNSPSIPIPEGSARRRLSGVENDKAKGEMPPQRPTRPAA